MNMLEAIKAVLRKYAVFNGRSRRAEYWWFYLATLIVYLPMVIVDSAAESGAGDPGIFAIILPLLALALLLPSLAVQVRRLHDINKSGWNCLWNLLPIVGPILLIVWFCRRGTVGDNRFGPDPLAPAQVEAG
jgi:uncharacterized membrane protein YhaH (DUF805 family)